MSSDPGIEKVKQLFYGVLPERLKQMELAIKVLGTASEASDVSCVDALETISQHAHNIAGVATSLGFPELTARARELDQLIRALKDRTPPDELGMSSIVRVTEKFKDFQLEANKCLDGQR